MSTTVNSSKENGHTAMAQTPGSKQIAQEFLRDATQPADIHKAPPSRVYTRDYGKVQPEKDDVDLVSPALGNPLRW